MNSYQEMLDNKNKGREASDLLKSEIFIQATSEVTEELMKMLSNEMNKDLRDDIWNQQYALRLILTKLEVKVIQGENAEYEIQQLEEEQNAISTGYGKTI